MQDTNGRPMIRVRGNFLGRRVDFGTGVGDGAGAAQLFRERAERLLPPTHFVRGWGIDARTLELVADPQSPEYVSDEAMDAHVDAFLRELRFRRASAQPVPRDRYRIVFTDLRLSADRAGHDRMTTLLGAFKALGLEIVHATCVDLVDQFEGGPPGTFEESWSALHGTAAEVEFQGLTEEQLIEAAAAVFDNYPVGPVFAQLGEHALIVDRPASSAAA